MQKIVATLQPNPYGPPPIQAHHAGSIWLYDGTVWRLVLNWGGIEWSAQFCADPAKSMPSTDAEAITARFPGTIPELTALGYRDIDLFSTPVTDATSIAKYVDSIWNSCVPIPQTRAHRDRAGRLRWRPGVHNYPESMCAIPRFMHDDFIPFVLDHCHRDGGSGGPGRRSRAPATPGSGCSSRRKAIRWRPVKAQASRQGAALVLGPDNPITQAAFARQ